MFRASLCPSSGDQDYVLLRMVLYTGCAGCGCVELERELRARNSPDDGPNDARNMLRQTFDNKHQISFILLVSLSSPCVHDARSQEPES